MDLSKAPSKAKDIVNAISKQLKSKKDSVKEGVDLGKIVKELATRALAKEKEE